MRRRDLRAALAVTVVAGAFLANACATTAEKNERRERVAGNEAWRETRPVAAAPAPVTFPNYQRLDLKNGLPVVLVEEHGLPAVYVTVAVRAARQRTSRQYRVALFAHSARRPSTRHAVRSRHTGRRRWRILLAHRGTLSKVHVVVPSAAPRALS